LTINVAIADQGNKAISRFLAASDRALHEVPIPSGLHSRIRNIQPFMPVAATTSRLLARHYFLTLNGNYLCRHHQAKAKRTPVIDGGNQTVGGFAVTGVPHARMINTMQTKATPADGYFNCGCSEDEVLMDFFFWKTWTITSPTTGTTEGWMDQMLDPRACVLVASTYKNSMKLGINNLYTVGFTTKAHKRHLLELQIARLKEELTRLENLEVERIQAAHKVVVNLI
jgi:hypothetical protein